jgi:hypothetical protein
MYYIMICAFYAILDDKISKHQSYNQSELESQNYSDNFTYQRSSNNSSTKCRKQNKTHKQWVVKANYDAFKF